MKKLWLLLAVPTLFFFACEKEKSFETGGDTDITYETSWQFKDTVVLHKGGATSYEVSAAGTEMSYEGSTSDGLGEFFIGLRSFSGPLTPGTYQSQDGEAAFSYKIGGIPQFAADNIDSIGEKLVVTILAIDSVSVMGFFTGTMRTASGIVIPVTEGKFNYRRTPAPPSSDTSAGTLGTAADTCTGAIIAGTYKKGVPLNASNTVTVNVNITKAGTYTIGTDTLLGFYFSKTGVFSTLGSQTIALNGTGTPLDSGTLNFRVRYGASDCGFSLSVDSSNIVPPVGDYFPLTQNNNWSYTPFDNFTDLPDTSYAVSTGTTQIFSGKVFSVIRNDYASMPSENSLIRKNAGLYYGVQNLDDLFGGGGEQEVLVLKDNVAQGSTWEDNFNISLGGQTVPAKISYTITEKAVPVTLGSLTFADVIKVNSTAFYTLAGVPVPVGSMEHWYAREVGDIYSKYTNIDGVSFVGSKLTRYTVY